MEPSFLTGTLIFGSILSAPEGVNVIEAYIEDELIGTGTVNGLILVLHLILVMKLT